MTYLILCPDCRNHAVVLPKCSECGFIFETIDDALDLRTDKSFDTLLDVASYNTFHRIVDSPDEKVFKGYQDLMLEYDLPVQGHVLEIACGSGKLTASMVAAECFESIHCGDISVDFMRVLSRRLAEVQTSTNVHKYLFDANILPFKDNSFDFVLGNSVLHHFIEFERTISDAYRVLKPGGAAIFGEPIFDGHALISLTAGLILRSPLATEENGFTSKHIRALRTIQKRLDRKLEALYGERADLQNVEDKFQFPAKFMRDLGFKIGYEKVVIPSARPNFDLGGTAKKRIYRILDRIGLTTEPLASFDYIFDALTEDYGRPMNHFMYPTFGLIAFIR